MTNDESKEGENKKTPMRLEISEIFIAKAGRDRCFYGIIQRETDENGVEISVFAKIKVNDGYIIAREKDQYILRENLDAIVLHVLDFGLHDTPGKSIEMDGTPFYTN